MSSPFFDGQEVCHFQDVDAMTDDLINRRKLVVYTVLTGDKEALGNPLSHLMDDFTDLDLSFVCFTDDPDLVSDVWDLKLFQSNYLPAEKMSRRPKALPHEYLQDWEWSLYIDNIVKFKRLPCEKDITEASETGFSLHRHSTRSSTIEEAEILVYLGYEDASVLGRQLEFYDNKKDEKKNDFGTCTIMLRRHGDENIKNFGRVWWENILNFSKRDQISFGFSREITSLAVKFYDKKIDESDLIYLPANASAGRVKSNFDEKKYTWKNRGIFINESARAHFLRVAADENKYIKKSSMMEFLAYKNAASLGEFHSPRRGIAQIMGDVLNSFRTMTGELLLVKTLTESELGFDDGEFYAAVKTFADFFPFLHINYINIAEVAQSQPTDPLNSDGKLFSGSIFFDFPVDGIDLWLDKYYGAIDAGADSGFIVLIGQSGFELSSTAALHFSLENIMNKKISCQIMGMKHDSIDFLMQNSCIIFSWNKSS